MAHRRPRMALLRLLLRLLLVVLVALAAVGRGAGTNHLQCLFASMDASQRYDTPPPWPLALPAGCRSRLAASIGDARVEVFDNPQELGDEQALKDVLAVIPEDGVPSTATVAVSLDTANFGANRLHAFVHFSADYVGDYDATAIVTAVLAPENAPAAVLREVQLTKAPDPALVDEWHEVLGDFDLLKQELGEEGQRIQLYVTLGVADATAGTARLATLAVEHLAAENVALLKSVESSVQSNDDSRGQVYAAGLTDAQVSSPTWTIFDNNQVKEEVWFVIDLDATYVICSVSVHFAVSAQVTEWQLFLATDDGLANDALWPTQALYVHDRDWPTSVYTSDTAQTVMTPDDWTADNWDSTIWRYQQLDDNPISSNRRYFSCTEANRAKLSLLHTNNIIFALMEVEIFGYEQNIMGPCELRCRHGGQCSQQSESLCSCPRKWGWKGTLCEEDKNECEPDDDDVASDPNGGCGGGSTLKAQCANTPGSWNCTCNPGFQGDSSTGDGNECQDINECRDVDRGGCKDICINSLGSYECECNNGYEVATGSEPLGDETSNTSRAGPSTELVLHRVTQLPLLGAACQPTCDKECQHGSACTSPNTCTPCDPGWHGQFCEKSRCTSDKGCYHGGKCEGEGGCSASCLGGWTGVACESAAGGLLPLLIGMCGAVQILPCLLIVLFKRVWPPFQERNVSVLMLGGMGALLAVSTSPAASNPVLYGIALDVSTVQAENQLWGHWLPFVAGYALWFSALLVRVRNLVVQHLRGGIPLSGTFQMLVAWAPWVGSGVLPTPVGLYTCVGLLVLLGGYFAMLSLQLLPLRRDLDDLLPNMIFGLCATVAMTGQTAMILGGSSYANPDGGVQIIFPALLSTFVGIHFFMTVSRLVWKLLRKDQAIMDKYDTGTNSDDYSDEETSATSRWKKGISGAKTAAILKLSTNDDALRPAGKGLLGMLSKMQGKNDTADESSDALSSSESDEYESSSMDEAGETSEPVLKTAPVSSSSGSSNRSSSEELEENSDSGSEDADTVRAAGRGGGRGRGRAARGRWSRGSRAAFNRGRGAGRSASRAVLPVSGAPPETTKTAKPQLRAATLLAKVQKTVPTAATESSDDVTTSSDDDELEQLAQEVKRFEKMMDKKVKMPGFVPVFTESEQGKGASEQLNLDTIMQKRILQRERQLYNPDEEDLMDTLAGYEMTEMEKLAAATKQQHVGDSRPTKDTVKGIPARGGAQTSTSSPEQRSSHPARGAQKIISETEEDIEIEMAGEIYPYLVDLESGLVFHLVASGEPQEVGTWNPTSRLIEFE